MLYSKTCEYAFRSLTHLANKPTEMSMVKHIAEEEGIPVYFLAKLLQDLAKMGLLRSFKGPTGGFMLAKPASEIALYDVMQLVDRSNLDERCAVGLYECSDNMPCPIHESWKGLREQMLTYLTKTTIQDLAVALVKKKKTLGQNKPNKMTGRKKTSAPRKRAK